MKIKPHFTALLTYLPAKDGVRTTPVSSGYRPAIKFPFDQGFHTGIQNFPETELVFPGDTVNADIALINAENVTGEIYEGLDFDFFSGTDLIGHGVVTKVLM